MLKNFFVYNSLFVFILISLLISLLSCVPTQQIGSDTYQCQKDYYFDPVSRKCLGGKVTVDEPVPTTSVIYVDEDSQNKEIILGYSDINNELAKDCIIKSITAEINNGN